MIGSLIVQIQGCLREACGQRLPVIQLMLPLEDPSRAYFSSACEEIGFFFAGVGCGDDGPENLVLQYVNSVDPGYDTIFVHSDFAKELKAYVEACHSPVGTFEA